MPKIAAEDLEKIIRLTGSEDSSGLRMAIADRLLDIWDRAYLAGYRDAQEALKEETNKCPYTFSHTQIWCGNEGCRES